MSSQSTPTLTLTLAASGIITAKRGIGFDGAQATVQGQKIAGIATFNTTDGKPVAVDAQGTTVIETGNAINVGDSLIVDTEGRAIPVSGPLGVIAGGTGVSSTSADGQILSGADLPEFVFADALEAAPGSGSFIEAKLR